MSERERQALQLDRARQALKVEEKYTAGEWTLWRLDRNAAGEERWSIGKYGPRMYLTCSESTAIMVLEAVANYSTIRNP